MRLLDTTTRIPRLLASFIFAFLLCLPVAAHAQFGTFGGNYFQNTTLSGTAAASQNYASINFDFVAIPPPSPIVESSGFSAYNLSVFTKKDLS